QDAISKWEKLIWSIARSAQAPMIGAVCKPGPNFCIGVDSHDYTSGNGTKLLNPLVFVLHETNMDYYASTEQGPIDEVILTIPGVLLNITDYHQTIVVYKHPLWSKIDINQVNAPDLYTV